MFPAAAISTSSRTNRCPGLELLHCSAAPPGPSSAADSPPREGSMHRAIIATFSAAALCASLAHAQTVTPAAPPPVVVMPRIVPSPSTTPTTCTLDKTGKPKPCPQTFPTLAPVPVIPPVPSDKPRTALSAAPARGVRVYWPPCAGGVEGGERPLGSKGADWPAFSPGLPPTAIRRVASS